MDEGRMKPGHWLGLVLSASFSALILTVGWQEGHWALKIPHSTNPQRFSSETGGRGGPDSKAGSQKLID